LAGGAISIHGNGAEYTWTYNGTAPPGAIAAPLSLRSSYGLYGLPNSGGRIGTAALSGTVSDGSTIRLTMNGKSADAYNCFNVAYKQTYNVSIRLMAQNITRPGKWFAWLLPLGVLSAWSGPSTAVWTGGKPVTLNGGGVEGAEASASADKINGCLALFFTPPASNKDTWEVTASIDFARAP
jgi:hypothetical protein